MILLSLFALAIFILLVFFLYAYLTTSAYPSLTRHDSEKFYFDTDSKTKRLFPDYSDRASLSLSVIVPAYNEEARLPLMMDEAMEYLEKRQKENKAFTYEVIIVDDGSADNTTQIGLTYSEKYGSEKVRILTFQRNRGKGGAVRLGVLSSRGEQILFVDADGASRFRDLSKLDTAMDKLYSQTAGDKMKDVKAIVCGSRAHLENDSIASRSMFRTVLMYGFHFIVWLLCVRGVKDTQCGFKLLSREAAVLLFSNLHVERWAFDVDLLFLAQHFRIPISEVAIQWQEIEGTKMVPVWSWLQMGRDIVLIRLRYTLGIWKIKTKL